MMTPELLAPISLWILVSSYVSAAGITYGPPAIRGSINQILPVIQRSITLRKVTLRKVGGIWWLRIFKLRVSFCLSNKP